MGPKLQGAHSWGNHQGCPLQLTACIQKNNSKIKNPKADKAGAVGGAKSHWNGLGKGWDEPQRSRRDPGGSPGTPETTDVAKSHG